MKFQNVLLSLGLQALSQLAAGEIKFQVKNECTVLLGKPKNHTQTNQRNNISKDQQQTSNKPKKQKPTRKQTTKQRNKIAKNINQQPTIKKLATTKQPTN